MDEVISYDYVHLWTKFLTLCSFFFKDENRHIQKQISLRQMSPALQACLAIVYFECQ